MASHEARCRLNPASRSCPTCAHNDMDIDEPEVGYWGLGWFCVEDHLPEGKVMITDCPHWVSAKSKEAQP